jgi:hypothetical protein
MDGLTEGRIVHFVMPDGQHRPAIVVKVWRPGMEDITPTTVGMVNLTVFVDLYDDAKSGPLQMETSVIHSENREVRTWHWIEKA